jgi:hypothetical protein
MPTYWWEIARADGTFTVASTSVPSSASVTPAGGGASGPYPTKAAAQAQASKDSGQAAKAGGGTATGKPANGSDYSYAQLEQLWINAGGSPSLAPLMAAIAEAESSGNPNATGGVGEKGLWQINPAAWGSLATYDPVGNARAAVHVYQSQGLGAWSTYTSGAYKAFINGATTPNPNGVPTAPGSGSGGGGGNVLTSTISPGTCVIPLNIPVAGQFCLLSKSQARGVLGVLLMIAGGMLLLPGVLVLAAAGLERTGAGAAASKAASAVPVGRAASAVRSGYQARAETAIARQEKKQAPKAPSGP